MAESLIGLFKTEVIHGRGPWKSLDAVEYATPEWVDWFNNRRLNAVIDFLDSEVLAGEHGRDLNLLAMHAGATGFGDGDIRYMYF